MRMSVALQRRVRNVHRQLRRTDATPEKGTRFAGLATAEGVTAPGAWQLANQLVLTFVYSDHCSAAAADCLRGHGRRQKRPWKMAFQDAKEAVEWTYSTFIILVTEWRLVAWLLTNRTGEVLRRAEPTTNACRRRRCGRTCCCARGVAAKPHAPAARKRSAAA